MLLNIVSIFFTLIIHLAHILSVQQFFDIIHLAHILTVISCDSADFHCTLNVHVFDLACLLLIFLSTI